MAARRGIRRMQGRDGFMLVEALAALALGALVLTALLSFTGIMRRSADAAAARLQTMEVSGRTVATVANEVRSAARLRWAAELAPTGPAATRTTQPAAPRRAVDGEPAEGGEGGTSNGGRSERQESRAFVFSGTPERLLFALLPEQASGLRAPVLVAYQIDPSGATLRAEGAVPATATGPAAVKLGPVLRIDPGPERLRFAFVDRQPNGGEVIVDAWAEPKRMPAAVRIDRTDPRTGLVLGSIRVPLVIDGEPGCADPGKGFCSRVDRKDQANRDQSAQGARRPSPSGEQE